MTQCWWPWIPGIPPALRQAAPLSPGSPTLSLTQGPSLKLSPPPRRFRQVRLKHRKLREQVNSMVDISKVPGSWGGGLGEGARWDGGWEAVKEGLLDLDTIAQANTPEETG